MAVDQHSYNIPDNQSISVLVSLLKESFPVRVLPETVYHRVFYDTFDWRLTRNGSSLEMLDDGPSPSIYWQADSDSKPKIQLGLRKVPHLADDLPTCALGQQLKSVIGVRELSPRIKIRIKRQSLAVLDENEKVVVRLHFDVFWYSSSKLRAARVLTRRLMIKAVKGYAEDYQRVESFFADLPPPAPFQTAKDNVLKLALIASGISSLEYSTNLKLRLDPFMPGDQALKMILLRLFEIMQQNTSGTIKGRDTEFMHDYRDALSKISVGLKQFEIYYPQDASNEYSRFFSRLSELTDPVRDIDVFLMQLENYEAVFDASDWQQLQSLRDYLLLSRAEAQNALNEELKSSQYRQTIKQWREYLKRPAVDLDTADDPVKPVYKLADEMLAEINQLALKQGKAISRNVDADALYELRKSFKQLRYSMDFFSSIYPAVELRALTQSLTDIQDDLGVFNDRHQQVDMVQAFVQQSEGEAAMQDASMVAIRAAEELIQILQQQQDEAAIDSKASYKKYASSASQKKFKALFVDYHQGNMKL